MTVKEAFETLYKELAAIYEPREAGNMATIVFEDAFPELLLHKTKLMNEVQAAKLKEIKSRLIQFEPLQYVLGEADFYGLRFKSDARALIPRPETEEIVHLMIKDIRKTTHTGEGLKLLDIGTGTGCIPLTLKHHLNGLTVHGLDVSPGALDLAYENAIKLNLQVHWHLVDIFDEEEWETIPEFDIIVSNPPYIPEKEKRLMSKNVLDFEPEIALFVENEQPIIFYKTITCLAKNKLKPSGSIYFETNEFNAANVVDYLLDNDFVDVEIIQDLQKRDRMIRANKRPFH